MSGACRFWGCALARSRWRTRGCFGRRAVMHWQGSIPCGEHPHVPLDRSVLDIDHGDVLTSAGTASALDACLHVVRSRLGADAANQVARSLSSLRIVRAVRRSTLSGRSRRPTDDPISRLLEWALARG